MANKTTKTAGTNKSFIDRMGGQKFIVFLIVIAMFIFFCAMSPGFRKYTTFVSILDYSYYIALMAIGVAFPLMTGGVDLSIGTGLICYSLVGGYLIVHQGWPTAAGMLVSILMGVAIGVLNGVLVAIMDLPGNLMYIDDRQRYWYNRSRRIWYSLAGSRITGRMVQKYL